MTRNPYDLLLKKFPPGEYAIMAEVGDSAGMSQSRWADFIVAGLWPSRGLGLQGIELKSRRNDWLREMKQPGKAEAFFQYCDRFWLLTTEVEGIASMEEIPSPWGWMAINGSRIRIMKEAPKLDPKPITRGFLAALLKRAADRSGYIRESEIEDRIKEAREQGQIHAENNSRFRLDELEELHKHVNEFEKASGIKIRASRWDMRDPTKMGQAVKFIMEGGCEKIYQRLVDLEERSKEIHQSIEHGMAGMTIEKLKIDNA